MFIFAYTIAPIATAIGGVGSTLALLAVDTLYAILNILLPSRRTKAVWGEYIPPKPTDSRCPCPALNALCNHGVLSRDGRNLTLQEIADAVHSHYNFSNTFCKFTVSYIGDPLNKSMNDKIDLTAIGTHNCIEHDGSLLREDTYFQADQGTPCANLVQDLFATTKNGKSVSPGDCSRALFHRFSHSMRTNPQCSITPTQVLFGASNAATIGAILGADIEILRSVFLYERIPDGWTPVNKSRFGLTILAFNFSVFRILLGINPAWKRVKYLS